MAPWITTSKEACEAIFYVIAATLGVLTYLQARKTLFQPLKVEVFKEQLTILTHILKRFGPCSEQGLEKEIGLELMIGANIDGLLDQYAFVFFGLPATRQGRRYSHLRHALMDPRTFVEPIGQQPLEDPQKPPLTPSGDVIVARGVWATCSKPEVFYLTNEYTAFVDQLQTWISHPLLPRACVQPLQAYQEMLESNTWRIRMALTTVADELPALVATPKDLERFSADWLRMRCMNVFQPLRPLAQEVQRAAREYLRTDHLFR